MFDEKIKKIMKSEKFIFWAIPGVTFLLIVFFIMGIGSKSQKNNVGKPEIFVAKNFGKIEEISVKPGDSVEPGKVLLRYTITDEKGKSGDNGEKQRVIDVTTKKIEEDRFLERVELPGLINPVLDSKIFSQVGGKIEQINVENGQHVKIDEVIAVIEKKDYKIALSAAQATFDLLEIQYKRVKKLIKQKAISNAEFDKAEAEFRGAQANLQGAQLALQRCEIRAPFTGIINQKFVDKGELVNIGTKIVNLIDIKKVKVVVGIPEQDVNYVRNLKKVDFKVSALQNRKFSGKVNNISFSTSDYAHVYPLELIIDNEDEILLPGMVVKADIIKKVHQKAVLLPMFSIIPGNNNSYYTYVMKNGKAEKRPIEIGAFQGRNVHIKKGLKAGDVVIEKGLRLVTEGSLIRDINNI